MADYSSVLIYILCPGRNRDCPFLSARMTKRAVGQVIAIFQKFNAIGIHQAKAVNELGLTPRLNLMERFTRMRDYKQNALSILMKAEIVQTYGRGEIIYFR